MRFLLLGACAASLAASTALGVPDPTLKKPLDALLSERALKSTQISAMVYSLTKDRELYSRGAEAALIPASAAKLLTAYTALKQLGPEFTFWTELRSETKPVAGVVRGDLYLRGTGDPSVVSERLFLLAADLARAGVRQVTGSVIVDASAYSDGHFHSSRQKTDSDRPFNAPTSAVSFNYNTTAVYALPATSPGAPAVIRVEPDTGYVRVVNKVTTGVPGAGSSIGATRRADDGYDEVTVTGSVAAGDPEKLRYLNVTDPEIYAGMALRFYLAKEGVAVSGGVKVGTAPANTVKLAGLESLPLAQIVTLMNKYSNNFIAEALVKAVAGKLQGYPTSLDQGMQALNAEAARLGIAGGGFKLTSPSGFNRENRMSAAHYIKLLRAAYGDLTLMPELLASLPIAGRDGTLETRGDAMGPAVGRLRAKTGTLDGVSTFAGVVQRPSGEVLAFALLLNESAPYRLDLRDWQNRFGRALVKP